MDRDEIVRFHKKRAEGQRPAASFRWHQEVVEFLEEDDLLDAHTRMADLLTRTANALKGAPGPLTMHSWHDLPEVAERLVRDLARVEASDADAVVRATAMTTRALAAEAKLELIAAAHYEVDPFYGHSFVQRKCACGGNWPCATRKLAQLDPPVDQRTGEGDCPAAPGAICCGYPHLCKEAL